jgi:tetratricopeptide (TPR) repeat protein
MGLLCTMARVWGDAAGDLYTQGQTALKNEQYDAAAQAFDQMIMTYPNTPNIDQARIQAGFAYLRANKFSEAVDRLAKATGSEIKPATRATALYLTGLAQFSEGQKSTVKSAANTAFSQAAATLTSLLDVIATLPDKTHLEDATYYRALSQYSRDDYDDAEKDLVQLTQSPQFNGSLSRPDYLLRLGSIYAVETGQAVTAKKPADVVEALAQKAVGVFDEVGNDPNALAAGNDANMAKAKVFFLLGQSDPTGAGDEKALEAFRLVRRKDDMIALQEGRVEALKKASQAQLQEAPGSSLANDTSLLIQREEERLDELKNGPDPIIKALILMAECYVSMKQPDEARTILHRLTAHATLTPDQQQEVDFQILYSYVLGGQTDQADKALTDYLSRHSGDPQADSISYQIAGKLLDRKDYDGALKQAQRSLRDFPRGKYAPDAVALEAQALSLLGRTAESDKIVDDFLRTHPNSPQANNMLLSRAQNETDTGNLAAALADYQRVKDNGSAGPDLQSSAAVGYIQTLNAMKRYSDVITEAKNFESQYPNSKAMPSVLLFGGLAMDQTNDPGAVAALQDLVRRYPKDPSAPYALFFVFNVYQRANNLPAMIQAENDLRKAYPDADSFIMQASNSLTTILIKAKKFDDAIALYQPLLPASRRDVAASASNKIGGIWLAATKALGYYQSMPLATRPEAEKRLATAEQFYVQTLKEFPDQLGAVGDAFDGLVTALKQRRSWGVLKDADMEGHLAKLGSGFTDQDKQTRLELAEAGLVFVQKDGAKQFPAALDRFKKAIAANPGLRLTRQETNQFGELLLAGKDYAGAMKIYSDLLAHANPKDQLSQADAYYGLGASYLGQGKVAQAKPYFMKMQALPQGAAWHPHILDADYGVALADEQSGEPGDNEAAQQIYGQLMRVAGPNVALAAEAMIGYGRILQKSGHGLAPTEAGPTEYAIHYYQEPNIIYGPAVPGLSAEGLFDAGQAYQRAGDKGNARIQYEALLRLYGTTAPEWAAKARAVEAQ